MKQETLDKISTEIDLILSENMGLPPKSATCGGWVSPDGNTFHKVREEGPNGENGPNFYHAGFVANHYKLFGITKEQFTKIDLLFYARTKRHAVNPNGYDSFTDSKESDMLLSLVYENGWTRVIFWGGEWHFTVENLGVPKCKVILEKMSKNLLAKKYDGLPDWTSNGDLEAYISSIRPGAPDVQDISIFDMAHGMLEESIEARNKNAIVAY